MCNFCFISTDKTIQLPLFCRIVPSTDIFFSPLLRVFLLVFFFFFHYSALEPRTVTRWDVHKYARQAYDLGVRYIGGCCGFEPYHIRAIAEEVRQLNSSSYPPTTFNVRIPWKTTFVLNTFLSKTRLDE